MEKIVHSLRRPLNDKYERLVRYIMPGDETENIEELTIELAVRILGNDDVKPREDYDFCGLAYNLFEKDRFLFHRLNVEDCLGYQLGIRSGMVGDIIEIPEHNTFWVVANVGFKQVGKERAEEIKKMPMRDRLMLR